MACASRRFSDQLKTERLEPEEHPRIQQWTGVNEQSPHCAPI
jgi:hypothetical protein